MPAALAIWLYGHQVAAVERQRNNRLRLSYTDYALGTYEGGTPLLSLALPLTDNRYPNGATRAFLDGLLPEGEPRRAIAEDLDLPASDAFGLLAALGRDCAGALVVQPEGDPPPPTPTTLTAQPLTADELGQLIANLHRAPLGIDRNVRLSLAGVQEKLLLARMPDGSWGRPVAGTPSTHILKPEMARRRAEEVVADTLDACPRPSPTRQNKSSRSPPACWSSWARESIDCAYRAQRLIGAGEPPIISTTIRFGLLAPEPHVEAQDLPHEQVGCDHDRVQTPLAPVAWQAAQQWREGRRRPVAVVGAPGLRHPVDGGDSLLLGDHPQDRRPMLLVAVEQASDRRRRVCCGDGRPASQLLLAKPCVRRGEQFLLGAEAGVQRLRGDTRLGGDLPQDDLLVGTCREVPPRRGEQALAGRRGRRGAGRHPVGALLRWARRRQALAYGVPVCAVPFGRDQLEVARRVEVAQAGTRAARPSPAPRSLRAKVRTAMACTEGARRIAAAFAATGGARTAADAFETRLLRQAGESGPASAR